MERRKFIRTSCSLCMLMTASVVMNSLSSCASLSIYKTSVSENKIKIPVSLFEHTSLQIVSVENSSYNIAVRKESDKIFTAVLLRCTHAANALTSTGKGFICNLHGSTFDNEGKVTKGPAELALKKYETKIDGNEVFIFID